MTPKPITASTLRAIPANMAADAVARVDARLDALQAEHGVALPLAVESGSRAWGYPSLDSDYDCRFVFIRPLDAYLTPWPIRNVSRRRSKAISTSTAGIWARRSSCS